MSHCRTVEEKLPVYLEGAGPEGERREIEKHLEACENCRAVLQDLKKTGALLAALEEKEPPPWFTQQVMARVKEEAQPRRGLVQRLFFPLRIKVPIEVMASLLVAVLAWQVYQTAPPEMKTLPGTPPANLSLPQKGPTEDAEKKETADVPPSAKEKINPGVPPAKPQEKIESAGGRTGEVMKREETIPAAQPAEAPPSEEKKTAAADRAEPTRPSMAPLPKSEPAAVKPAPAPTLQATPRRMERELKEKDEAQKSEVFRDKARIMGKAASEMPSQILTVRVREVAPALKTVQELLQRIGAENIREETETGRKFVSGAAKAGDLDLLTEKLKAIGEVSSKEYSAPATGQRMLIRIEIVPMVP
jgi:hypothetical protein